jgi:predicted RNA-binding Zn-ribbon protein involved in translation (DUF1610 family)
VSYLVVDCQGCGSTRIVEADQSTGECPRCGTTIQIDSARVHARTDDLTAAQDALGQVNAQRADGELLRPDELAQEAGASSQRTGKDPQPTARDEIDHAIREAREVASERMQVRLVAEGLTERLDTFTEEDWLEAMSRLDVPEPRAREHLQRLSRRTMVAEPQHGTYRYIE